MLVPGRTYSLNKNALAQCRYPHSGNAELSFERNRAEYVGMPCVCHEPVALSRLKDVRVRADASHSAS